MYSKNSDREKKNKNFGASVGKPSGVVQVFQRSAILCRSLDAKQESDKGRSTKGDPERMQAHTTNDKRRAGKRPQIKQFLLLYRYNCTKSKIFAKKVKKNLVVKNFVVSLHSETIKQNRKSNESKSTTNRHIHRKEY